MTSTKAVATVLVALVALTSCSRDPEVAKRKYLESGNKYFDKGKFKEARIMYKDALQKDRRFGPAWYHLGLTALRLSNLSEAVSSLRNAIELVPPESPDHWDAVVKLADILVMAGAKQKQYLDEVAQFSDQLLKRDANSFDGHRLAADLNFARALEAVRTAHRDEALDLLNKALQEYERANRIQAGNQGVMIQLARTYGYQLKLAESEALYRQIIAADKTFQPPYFELYRQLMVQNRQADAEQILKDAFASNPKQFSYLPMLATHYSAQGRREEMVAVLQEIKTHAKEFDQAYLVVGDFYLRLGDGDAAIREYRDGITKDAAKKTTYQKRVIEVLMRQGKRAEAADLNSQVLKIDPNDNDAKGLAATLLLDKGEISRALADLQAVVVRAPENPVAQYQLGRAHLARGEWEQARQFFQKAVELRPDYLIARLALAQLQIFRGEFDAALKTAAQVLAVDRDNVNAHLIESAALMGQKKYGDSRTLLNAMLKANPGSTDAYFQLGVLNLAESKYKEAEDAFRKSYELNPASPRGLMGLIETVLAQGHQDAAIQILRTEAEKNPNRPDIRVELGNTEVRSGRYDEAIAEFQKVLNALDKDNRRRGDVLLRIGETYRRKGDSGNAITALQQARNILPENVTILSTLALTLDTGGHWAEAKQVYEAALKLDNNNGVALNNLAFLMAEHNGDLDEALTKGQKAKQLLPNLPEVSDTLGWIYLKKNLSDNAIEIFRDLVAKAPTQAIFRYHLGMALSQKGDRPRAIKELQEALKSGPTKDERDKIQALLGKLGA